MVRDARPMVPLGTIQLTFEASTAKERTSVNEKDFQFSDPQQAKYDHCETSKYIFIFRDFEKLSSKVIIKNKRLKFHPELLWKLLQTSQHQIQTKLILRCIRTCQIDIYQAVENLTISPE